MPSPAPQHESAEFFDLSLDLLCIGGWDGYYRFVNTSFERVLGYSRDELLSRPYIEFIHPDDREHAREALSRLATTGEDVVGLEVRLVCADGSVRRFEWNTRTMPQRDVVYAIGRDVTDRTALANEQAALRRVATLVARESSPDVVFACVAEEVGRLLELGSTAMFRYEDDETFTVIANWGAPGPRVAIGDRLPLGGHNIVSNVFRTAACVRINDYADATGAAGVRASAGGVRSAVGVPIVVDGRLWGAMVAAAAEPLPQDTESRMGGFIELVATAISKIDARSALTASRARLVAAADEERRRVVRDLHDGAQQRLVNTVISLKLAQRALERHDAAAPSLVSEALQHAESATHELRELAHGILPAALTTGGLRTGVDALASRMPVPVEIEIPADRLPAAIEATAYFVVAEALTNVAKHASAASVAVAARVDHGTLQVEVRDDGVGGARPDGSGLLGLADRLAAHDGRLRVESPADGGTLVAAAIPLSAATASEP
jgi:PAS domain S-box-containing protein